MTLRTLRDDGINFSLPGTKYYSCELPYGGFERLQHVMCSEQDCHAVVTKLVGNLLQQPYYEILGNMGRGN